VPTGGWPGGLFHDRRVLAVLVVDHAHFQGGGAAEDVLGLGRVLHAGQLHDDAVGALLLDHRLGHAQFVDAVVQGGDVLLDGEFLDALLRFRLERGGQLEVGAVLDFVTSRSGWAVLDGGARLVAHLGVAEADGELVAFAGDAAVAHVLVAHQGAQVGGGGVEALGQRPLHVDLQQEMHAAAQVQAQVHGQGVHRGQPGGEFDSRLSATT
jgi:hypothetical protein